MNDDYAGLARLYDQLTARPMAASRRKLALLCRRLNLRRVLDLGCGTGLQMRELEKAGIFCAGVDCSQAMLEQARLNLSGSGRAALFNASARELPFKDSAFDAALICLMLHESACPAPALLAEALRVAGKVLILDWHVPERNLDYPGWLLTNTIERLAGKKHYARFRAYARSGGLPGLIAAAPELEAARDERLSGGLFRFMILKKSQRGVNL